MARGLVAALACGGIALAQEATEPPGEIHFVGENAVLTADGTFGRWRVTDANVDFDDLAGSFVEVEVDVASIDTGIERRDEHLRTADFFDVERWPTATVRIDGVAPDGEDAEGRARYTARFTLRIRDVEKTVSGRFHLVSRAPPTVEGQLTVDRNDWGIGEPKTWNPLSLSDDVPIRFRATLR